MACPAERIPHDAAPDGPALTRWVVAVAAGLVLAGTLWRLTVALPTDAHLNFVSGVWVGLADDLAHGEFYRPIMSDVGYGGTRYLPLRFVLHGAIIALGVDPIRAGYPIDLAAAAALAAGAYALMRRYGVGVGFGAGMAILTLSTLTLQTALVANRGDLLPAALNLWGLVFVARSGRTNDRSLVWAALLFGLAFGAKISTVFGLMAALGALWLEGRAPEARRLALWSALALGVVMLLAVVLSGGRVVEYFVLCGSGGAGWASLRLWPRVLYWVLMRDPLGMVFVTLGAGVLLGARRAEWRGLPSLAFLCTLVVTALLFLSPGVSYNHLIDIEVIAVALVAVTAARGAWLPAAAGIVAVAGVMSLGHALMTLRAQDIVPARAEGREVLALTGPAARPLLSENPVLPVLNGERPVVLDPFSLRVAAERGHEVGRRLLEDVRGRRFRAIVLKVDLSTPEGEVWYRESNFGAGFREAVLGHYRLSTVKHGYYIYLPAAEGAGVSKG